MMMMMMMMITITGVQWGLLRRTFEIRGKIGQEGGTHYRHAGRDHVRLQPLVRVEVTHLISQVSGNS